MRTCEEIKQKLLADGYEEYRWEDDEPRPGGVFIKGESTVCVKGDGSVEVDGPEPEWIKA